MQLRWLELTQADVPSHDDWLGTAERARLCGLRVPKRRDDWRLGRWTAKQAVAAYLEMSTASSALAAIEIIPAETGSPEAFIADRPAPVSVSISHREARALCAVAPAGTALGCDVEFIEPRSEAFVADYFTVEEQRLVAQSSEQDRFRLLALLWSAKESALKALRTGLRLDTRDVSVDLTEALNPAEWVPAGGTTWRPLRAQYSARIFDGWWQCSENFVRTCVSDPASPAPILLKPACVTLPSL
jgi:4'-phosphopantetheinyl transferase